MDNSIEKIGAKLWEMANELRGNMDASEYKNYILAFMFYRYLSEHQEKYFAENVGLTAENGKTLNDDYVEKAAEYGEDQFIKLASDNLGYAIAPNDTWASLIKRIDEGEVIPSDYQAMFDNFNNNAKLNVQANKDFQGVFNDVNLGDNKLGTSTTLRAKSLSKIVKLVDSMEYTDENGKDILGAIYEYLIKQFASSAGKKGGEFYTPHEVSIVLSKLVTLGEVDQDKEFSVYDPTCGSGSLLLTVGNQLPAGMKDKIQYFGQELNTTTYNLARMNLMMHNVDYFSMHLSNADTLEQDWPDGPDAQGIDRPRFFDAVVANPPYSAHWNNAESKLKDPRFSDYGKLAPKTKADYAFVLHSLYHLNANGKMAIVLPHGVLFRGAAEEMIRKNIIDKNYLDAVIGLPANLFYGTSIPTCVVVFKKNRSNKDILFIDASKDFEKAKNQNRLTDENIDKIIEAYKERKDIDKYAHVASLDEIKENDYNLNIPRYVDTFEEEPEIDLAEVNRQLKEDDAEITELEKKINEQLKLLGIDEI